MGDTVLTLEEIVGSILGSDLPTVLVEGNGDMRILRRIEHIVGAHQLNFLSCGGRTNLLAVFEQRSKFQGKKVAFYADKDLWYFTGVPAEYADIVFTYGYCVENDLYYDGKPLLDGLLEARQRTLLEGLMLRVAKWFAFEVQSAQLGLTAYLSKFSILNPDIVATTSIEFQPTFLEQRQFQEPDAGILQLALNHHFSGLHGKLIFDCYFKILQHFRSENGHVPNQAIMKEFCLAEWTKTIDSNSRIQQIILVLQNKLQ